MDARKLFFVTGKGGVGKSTVVAALARHWEARGLRVLVALAESNERLSLLLKSDPFDHAIQKISEGIWAVNIEPPESIQEYGEITLGSKRASAAIFTNRHVQSFLAAVPGLYQWAVLGKVLYHTGQVNPDGSPRFHVVIFDAPATGHAVEMLRVPRVITEVVPAGVLRRDAVEGWRKLTDPVHTSIVLVTLPEPTPIDETLQLAARLTEIGVAPSRLVVNQVFPPLFREADARALASAQPAEVEDGVAAAAVNRARDRAGEELLQADAIARLERELPIQSTHLPHVLGAVDATTLSELCAVFARKPTSEP